MADKILEQFKNKFLKSNIYFDPFPHIIMDNIFNNETYRILIDSFPSNSLFANDNILSSNNLAISLSHQKFKEYQPSSIWLHLINYLSSKEFFYLVVLKYKKYIEKFYPDLTINDKIKIGKEGYDSFDDNDFLLDCRFGINTPSDVKTSVRGAHFDSTKLLYTGLIYFKDFDNNTKGGDFTIYEKNKKNTYINDGRLVSSDQIKFVKEVSYHGNNSVCFLNSDKSIHGVSVKHPSKFTRKYLSFNAVYCNHLFLLKNQFSIKKSFSNYFRKFKNYRSK